MNKDLNEQELIRRKKMDENSKNNIENFHSKKEVTNDIKSLIEKFSGFTKEELEEKKYEISTYGRILTKRGPFTLITLGNYKIQIYLNNKTYPNLFSIFSKYDLGDIVWVKGIMMKTHTNELAIKINDATLLTKSLKPLPEKYHGLVDVEERYRHRYVDLIVNDDVRETFINRTKIIKFIRNYFDSLGYLEVDTPVLQPILGGASAKPFVTFFNALNQNFYLRIATELPLKKLLVGGFEKVYEIGRIFRNEGVDTTHNPEFTSIEFYEANTDFYDMMNRCEDLIKFVAKKLGKEKFIYQGFEIDLSKPFKKINMIDAISEKINIDVRNATFEQLKEFIIKKGIKIESYYTYGHLINVLFENYIEEDLIEPTFVFGHPIEISPLALKDKKDPRFTQRAELFIAKKEYANMFSELNDPLDQLKRFENQLNEKNNGNEEASEIDYDFVEALEYGLPPAGGCGIGIDRLVMLLTNNTSIREVILFPHLKNIKNNK